MHITITAGPFFAGELIGFTTGLLITVLLLVLNLRAAKLPGTPLANIVFAVCALLWCAGGLMHTAFLASGLPRDGRLALLAQALQFTGACAFPIPILATWRRFAVKAWQQRAARMLQMAACIPAAAIAIAVWSGPVRGSTLVSLAVLHHFAAYSATLLLVLGAAVALRRRVTPRAVYLPSLAIVLAVSGASIMSAVALHGPHQTELGDGLASLAAHLVLLVVLCAFFLFARFRFADIFLRYGVRILLAGVWASVLAFTAQSPLLLHIARQAGSPGAVHVFAVIIVANALLLSFTFVDERISALVNRWLFRPPDYRAARRRLADQLRDLPLESEIAAAAEDSARRTLELSAACLIALDKLPAVDTLPPSKWPAGILDGEIVELAHADPLGALLPLPNIEVLVPISAAGRVTHLLLVSPGQARPGLVTHDLEYLRAVAALTGNRLDALRREREAAERQSREALLLQQVTESELRALRAQINPHFLFNSLNTIADQVVRDPARAEAMTLRLAGVFRHVLDNSSRPLTSIRDEIEFLRTYLYIEEVRFGDRLQVEIDVAPAVAGEHLPSLILQPLVENALKHGLGPKPGPGHLWISAAPQDGSVCLKVEDDGMGIGSSALALLALHHRSDGLGLTNVAERLRTLYQDRASLILEPRDGGGTRATLLIPRHPPESPT
ncbi:MAG TPA: sensor histidine kinase [Candidatus Acidoferrales bacterium]|nr:sensor histidine kinase [Candidatus Acidoferrales bacterium]